MKLQARKVRNYDLYANHVWYVPGVGGMFALLGWVLIGSLLGSLVTSIFALFVPPQTVVDYGTLIAYPLTFIPAMIFVAQKSRRNCLFEPGFKLTSSHFGPFKAWQVALITVLLTFGTMISADLPNYLNYRFTQSIPFLKKMYDVVTALLEQMTGGPLWSSFLLAAVFAPIFEEWLCRGMVLRGLLTKMKPAWAIVVSALFFALIHFNPWQALNAFILGLAMGYVYYKTGNLWLTMLIHFVNNATAVVLSQIPSIPEDLQLAELMSRQDYTILYICGLLVLAAGIWAFSRIPLQQERGNVDAIELKAE